MAERSMEELVLIMDGERVVDVGYKNYVTRQVVIVTDQLRALLAQPTGPIDVAAEKGNDRE